MPQTVITRILPLLVLFAASACATPNDKEKKEETPTEDTIAFRIDGILDFVRGDSTLFSINIEIADDDSSQTRGMMQRTSFPPNSGMLFLFDDREQIGQFWMGNTALYLDLLFIAADSQIVDFAKQAIPFSDDPIIPRTAAQHVLEVPGGFVDSRGIVEGDHVRWHRNSP